MKKLNGNTDGLKPDQIRRLENLYRRRAPHEMILPPDAARDMARLSHEIHRQVGVLIDREGRVVSVIVGDAQKIVIPDTPDHRTLPGRLKGLRCIHTHLKNEALTSDDLNDLALLRLDMMAVITLFQDGGFREIHIAHILPQAPSDEPYRIMAPLNPTQLDIGCLDLIHALEAEMDHIQALHQGKKGEERAILVSVYSGPRRMAEDSMAELRELARSSGIHVDDTLLQQRSKKDARFLMGRGKIQELNLRALQKGINLIIFDQELNPSQIRSITDQIDMKVIDRTQLILDIFARRAQTSEGKLQVELAQLKYLLPRLVTKDTAMSRLTGGIGGRGPGETKLEINRRRARDRINQLEKALDQVIKRRQQQKARRSKKDLPVISIVGYTNAGKSTLLNTLTHSDVLVEDKVFATLDPSSRRLRFPRDIEVIITDTVGFIRDLPKDLMTAFRATLEELNSADLLVHVIDASNPRFEDQILSVEGIISDLGLQEKTIIRVLNKKDLVEPDRLEDIIRGFGGIAISARDRSTLIPLIQEMENQVQNFTPMP